MPRHPDACVTHGAYRGGIESPEHYVWRAMIQREGKGHWANVKVCKRWRKYENFIADMGPRPTPKHSIDRFPDASGDYKKSNCRWATQSQQMRNKRTTLFFTDGERVGTVGEWAVWLDISVPLARYRWRSWGTFVEGTTFKIKINGGAWKPAPPPRPHKPNPNSVWYTDGLRTGCLKDWADWLEESPACLWSRWKHWGSFEKGKKYALA